MRLRERTPDQWADLVGMLGAADSIFRDLAQQPDTNGLFRLMLQKWARTAVELQTEITEKYNEEQR